MGARIGLPSIMKIRVDAEGYLYKVEVVDQGATAFGSQFQADIVVSAGLVFAFM